MHPISLLIQSELTGETTQICSPSWLYWPLCKVARNRTSVISQEISAIEMFSSSSQNKKGKKTKREKRFCSQWIQFMVLHVISALIISSKQTLWVRYITIAKFKDRISLFRKLSLGFFCAVAYPTEKCVRRNCKIAIFLFVRWLDCYCHRGRFRIR